MSTFGSLFRVTTYGESHCKSVGCIVDGVPPGMELTEDDIQPQLTRRRPGQSRLTTPRDEKDRVAIQSGTEFGITLGTPIGMIVQNKDQRPHDYLETEIYPRPSHADWTYLEKYGVKASSGGGRSSARETIGRVAAGAIAEKYLALTHNVEIVAFVSAVGTVGFNRNTQDETFRNLIANVTRDDVDQNIARCPVNELAEKMIEEVEKHRSAKDSIGGVVTCVIRNVPPGLGEPCFDKLEAQLAHAMLSIPATKGFEIGSGFAGTTVPGSKHNDPFIAAEKGAPILEAATSKDGDLGLLKEKPVLRTKTNNSGGIQGGISNGESIYFSVAFKPPATISQGQATSSYTGNTGTLEAKGRHDPNVVPRAVPIVEAMAALVLIDACLVQQSRIASRILLPAVPLKGNAVALTAGKNSTK